MIIDRIEQHQQLSRLFGKAWKQTFEFLKTVSADTPCGKYPLDGDNLYVGIDSYETKSREKAKLETHRRYIDIQVMISGRETQEVFPSAELTVSEPYNPENDAQFYQIPQTSRTVINLRPGDVVVYFPHDAHMPCLTTGGAAQVVKKAVVKVAVATLSSPSNT